MGEKQCILCDSYWVIHRVFYQSLIVSFDCIDCGFSWDEIDYGKEYFK